MTHEATEVFCYMSSNRCSIQSSSFNMLIKGVCETGKVDEAIRLQKLAYYSGTSSTSSTYSAIMLGLSKLDKAKDLLVVLSKMLVEGCNLDLDAYCILIQSMSLQNRVKECILLFRMMVNEGLIPDSERLFNLLSCIANLSQLHVISDSIDKLASSSEALNSAIYNVLINGLWKEGYKREACRLLDIMLEKGWVPDAKTHGLLIGSAVSEEVDWKCWTILTLNQDQERFLLYQYVPTASNQKMLQKVMDAEDRMQSIYVLFELAARGSFM
ncbi:pentatricopeptide repeat-containing protein [Prunus yedoensis var. nudiflora]|uniref:Pentatricopeptide repeat-containing protein n=1 Tax=Prunus yedoensis var. nudiflora TaxID=2094558 RepID=A0A314XYB7_PRUYE|nr:pentatricopeptide repeat-containing protein [Prunus yedoensis var. nudiflora]